MMQSMYSHSYLFGGNAPFIEELYEQYLADANSVPNEWRDYFDKLAQAPGAAERDVPHMPIQESFIQLARSRPPASAPAAGGMGDHAKAGGGAETDFRLPRAGQPPGQPTP